MSISANGGKMLLNQIEKSELEPSYIIKVNSMWITELNMTYKTRASSKKCCRMSL